MRSYEQWVVGVMNRQLTAIEQPPSTNFSKAVWWVIDLLSPMTDSLDPGHTYPAQIVEVFGIHDTAVSLLKDLYAPLSSALIYVAVDRLKGVVEGVLELEGNALLADYYVHGIKEKELVFSATVNLHELTVEDEVQLKNLYYGLCDQVLGKRVLLST